MVKKIKHIVNKHIKSETYALAGLRSAFSSELNLRIEIFIAIIVIALGFVLRLDLFEWVLLINAVFIVIITELLNTALEYLADGLTKDFNNFIKQSKDIGAAAVWVASLFAIILAVIIAIHYLGRTNICFLSML